MKSSGKWHPVDGVWVSDRSRLREKQCRAQTTRERHALNEPLSIEGVGERACSAGYRCANFAGRVLSNRAALAADWVANLAMSSRRRNFCFLNLLNLALSPFCDDICPRSSNLFVTQRAEDKPVRSSIRQPPMEDARRRAR